MLVGVLLAALTLAACSSSGPAGSRSVSVFRLRPGDCLITPKKIQAELTSIEEVPCTTPHTQQVYALVRDHGGSTYPPATALDSFANAQCLDHFAAYVGVPYQDSSLYFTYLLPSVRSWAAGDRTVVCVAETVGKPLRRSVQGSKL
ncbi:MAG: septum formation family protein [Actinomycetota bacterium]|nr:septum formation family protein [Actinomycetota bacterium]